MINAIGWTFSLVTNKEYMYQEYWDDEWLGANDIWEQRGDNKKWIFYKENYNMDKYGK